MAKKLPTDDLFEKSTMTFGEHLEELRVCLFRSVVGIAMGCLIGFFVANWVVRFFQSPLERAMAQYYVEKAVIDFGHLIGKTPPVEVERQILDEGLIPEPVQIEPAQVADALRLTYPETFAGLQIPANWFTPGDFLPGGAARLCRELAAAKGRAQTARGRMWELLDNRQREAIEQWAKESEVPSDGLYRLLEILNDLAGKRDLHEATEFAGVLGPDATVTATWMTSVWSRMGRP